MNTCALLRSATNDDDHLAEQLEKINNFVSRRGEHIDISINFSIMEISDMLKELKIKEVTRIYVTRIDRLTRRPKIAISLIRKLLIMDIEIVSVEEDFDTRDGQNFLNALFSLENDCPGF